MYQKIVLLLFTSLNVDTTYKKSLAHHYPRGLKNQRILLHVKRNWRRLLYMSRVYPKDGTYVFSKTGTRPSNA
uniref:Putative ovule protein n=1 Tax=Solanum chacoense TaxID=4108 RepID=A0A0V0HUS4_SOLCH